MKIGHKIQHYLKNSHLTEYEVGINSSKTLYAVQKRK